MGMFALFFDNYSARLKLTFRSLKSTLPAPHQQHHGSRQRQHVRRHRHHQASALSRSPAPLPLSPAAAAMRQRPPALNSIATSLVATVGVQTSPSLSGSLKSARTGPDYSRLFIADRNRLHIPATTNLPRRQI